MTWRVTKILKIFLLQFHRSTSERLLQCPTVKRLLLALAAVPVIAFAQTATGGIFLDVLGHPHESDIEYLHSRGIVQGYGYGIFRPDILINRAEFLKILMLASEGSQVFDVENRRCFQDFRGEEQWYWVHACSAKEQGVIEGYPDGFFRPNQTVNAAEALKMAYLTFGIATIDTGGEWYQRYLVHAQYNNVLFDTQMLMSLGMAREDTVWVMWKLIRLVDE